MERGRGMGGRGREREGEDEMWSVGEMVEREEEELVGWMWWNLVEWEKG